MGVRVFDLGAYTGLLAEAHPTVPQTQAENERLLRIVETLTEKPGLSPEEKELLEVLLVLIQKFEDQRYATRRAKPDQVLRELMRAQGVRPKDLYDVFGSRGTTSEVIHGKRAISKTAAKRLAAIFHVPADRFL